MSIDRYLEQLVSDIRVSAKNRDQNVLFPKELIPEVNLPDHLAHLSHLPVIPAQKVHRWLRLDPSAFPPANQLNEDQTIYFCNILKQLYEHYNFDLKMPLGLPFSLVYEFLIKAMDMVSTCTQEESTNSISFCEGDEANCPFGEYCTKMSNDICDTWFFCQTWDGDEFSRKNL